MLSAHEEGPSTSATDPQRKTWEEPQLTSLEFGDKAREFFQMLERVESHTPELQLVTTSFVGDCLFEALAIGEGRKRDAQAVRLAITLYLRNHPHQLESLVRDEDLGGPHQQTTITTIDQYISSMERPGTWGSRHEILAFASCTNRPVVIITGREHINPVWPPMQPGPMGEPIYVAYLEGTNHYFGVTLKRAELPLREMLIHQSEVNRMVTKAQLALDRLPPSVPSPLREQTRLHLEGLEREPFVVTLHGPMGVGKTSLLIRILGKDCLVDGDGGRSVSAVPVEISSNEGVDYHIGVQSFTREELEGEICPELLKMASDFPPAKNLLEALCLHTNFRTSEDGPAEDPRFVLRDEVLELLQSNTSLRPLERIPTQTELRRSLKLATAYTTKDKDSQLYLRLITTKRVTLSGPFHFPPGLTFVDLPGELEAMTFYWRKLYEKSDFKLYLQPIKRAISDMESMTARGITEKFPFIFSSDNAARGVLDRFAVIFTESMTLSGRLGNAGDMYGFDETYGLEKQVLWARNEDLRSRVRKLVYDAYLQLVPFDNHHLLESASRLPILTVDSDPGDRLTDRPWLRGIDKLMELLISRATGQRLCSTHEDLRRLFGGVEDMVNHPTNDRQRVATDLQNVLDGVQQSVEGRITNFLNAVSWADYERLLGAGPEFGMLEPAMCGRIWFIRRQKKVAWNTFQKALEVGGTYHNRGQAVDISNSLAGVIVLERAWANFFHDTQLLRDSIYNDRFNPSIHTLPINIAQNLGNGLLRVGEILAQSTARLGSRIQSIIETSIQRTIGSHYHNALVRTQQGCYDQMEENVKNIIRINFPAFQADAVPRLNQELAQFARDLQNLSREFHRSTYPTVEAYLSELDESYRESCKPLLEWAGKFLQEITPESNVRRPVTVVPMRSKSQTHFNFAAVQCRQMHHLFG
ncbi:hypothetical protein HDV00_010772 [Rhizophlyctis rosea]|nr:hypothetical protein HDV00_010772 [Rhizophlyctis rosea]